MTFWSDVTLKKRLPELISPYSADRVEGASYELGVGGEVYVTPDHEVKAAERIKRKMSDGDSVNIPRGQFAFLITDEIITVPNDAVAFISIKAKIKFKGLVNISGFHVDPGYTGRLVFSVFNAGASDVVLDRNERAFLIWYASLDQPSETPKSGRGYMNIPSELVNGISDSTLSLAVLDSKISNVAAEVKRIYHVAIGIVGFVAILSLIGFGPSSDKASVAPGSVEKVYILPDANFVYPPRFDYLDCSALVRNVGDEQSCK